MATYIKGVTDVMPKLSPVNVDYKLLSTSLAALQNRYNKGADQIKSMYNSLINGAVSSADNEEFRREYLKKADAAMSQLAGVDLANPANVAQAMSLFNPLVEDQQFSTDLYLTRAQNAEMAKLENVKLSTDEKVRAQYSNIMEQYLGIGKQRLTEMRRDDGSISKARINKFTPWQDPVEYASAVAKEQGLKVEYDYRDGLNKVTQINGGATLGIYEDWFKNTIGNKFDEQFRIEAEVDLEKATKSMMSQDPNLTRQTATQKLAQDFSGKYVSLYNDQLSNIQAKITDLDNERRKMERKYPNKVPPDVYKELVEKKKLKDNLSNQLETLVREKGDDTTFQQRAVELFMNNPTGTFVPEIRKRYTDRFAAKQAYGVVSTKYEADQVALQTYLQNDRQSFEWGKMLKQNEFDLAKMREQMSTKFKYDLALKQVDKRTDLGVSLGQMQDVGAISPETMFKNTYMEHFNASNQAYLDTKVLSVAANFSIEKSGVVNVPSNINMQAVTGAIGKMSSGTALSPSEKQQLGLYLDNISAGLSKQIDTMTFPQLQRIISGAVGTNSLKYPEVGTQVYSAINQSNTARAAYGNMWMNLTNNLLQLKSNPKYSPYIKATPSGGLDIDYDKVNRLDGENKELMYRDLMGPMYNQYKDKSAAQTNSIVLSPSDPSKFDYNILRQAVVNAEKVGVTRGSDFGAFEDDQLKNLKDILLGGQNLKNVLDPQGTEYKRKIINNQEYIQVTIPVLKGTDGKSKATTMNIDPTGDVAANNKIEFLVPLDKAMNLASPDDFIMDPITGQKVLMPNYLTPFIQEMAGKKLVEAPTSWVSQGLLSQNQSAALPDYLTGMLDSGYLYVSNDRIHVSMKERGESNLLRDVDITDETKIRYSDFVNNPAAYDGEIRTFIEGVTKKYDKKTMTYNHNAVKNNETKAATNSDWIPWSQIPR
jgi:hypothetical protein